MLGNWQAMLEAIFFTVVLIGWVNQAYSRLSITHGHIADLKLDSVVYGGVCVVT